MPSRQAARTFYPKDVAFLDARSRIEALFGSPHTDYPLLRQTDEMDQWRNRRLKLAYAMAFFDSLVLRTRDDGLMRSTRLHLALGILDDGTKDIIGVWAGPSAAVWPNALSQLRARGVSTIAMVVAEDDAAGLAARTAFPATHVVYSAKRLVEDAADVLPLTARRAVIGAMLKTIIQAPASGAAAEWETEIEAHASMRLDTVLALPPTVRELICTTSAVESIVEKLRRRGLSKRTNYASTDVAIRELAFTLRDAATSWKVTPRKWSPVRQFLRERG